MEIPASSIAAAAGPTGSIRRAARTAAGGASAPQPVRLKQAVPCESTVARTSATAVRAARVAGARSKAEQGIPQWGEFPGSQAARIIKATTLERLGRIPRVGDLRAANGVPMGRSESTRRSFAKEHRVTKDPAEAPAEAAVDGVCPHRPAAVAAEVVDPAEAAEAVVDPAAEAAAGSGAEKFFFPQARRDDVVGGPIFSTSSVSLHNMCYRKSSGLA